MLFPGIYKPVRQPRDHPSEYRHLCNGIYTNVSALWLSRTENFNTYPPFSQSWS